MASPPNAAATARPVRRSTWRWHAILAYASAARYLPPAALKLIALRKIGGRIVQFHLQDIWQDEVQRRTSMLPPGRRWGGDLMRINQQDLGWAVIWPPDQGMQRLDRAVLAGFSTKFFAVLDADDQRTKLAYEDWDLRNLRTPKRSLQNPLPVEGSWVGEGRGYTQDYEGSAGHGPEAGKVQRWRIHYGSA
jgi:hypothetical protein